jgi:hypothetical protein
MGSSVQYARIRLFFESHCFPIGVTGFLCGSFLTTRVRLMSDLETISWLRSFQAGSFV